ncbi:MAG: MerR family transcriptional regulator [Actinobacteria bacterium]|nr:MerR family transcriptional regulator [Actinomycetota bacterium]
MTTVAERPLRIGEVAELVGVTTRTIRYYEELGLLGGVERSKGAHRTYTEADVARLRELIRLRDLLGLSLEELVALAEAEEARAALRDQWHGDPTTAERIAILTRSSELVRQQIDLVEARRARLDEFAAELREKLASLQRRRRALERGA